MDFIFYLTIKDYPICYIAWNTLLGGIPFFLCFLMFRLSKSLDHKMKNFKLFVLFVFWLLVVPNAAYIVTDVRHLNGFCPDTMHDNCMQNAWMIFFFFVYGFWGWLLHFYSMEQFYVFLKNNITKRYAIYFPLLISPVLAIAVMLGLVERYNSWDMLSRPLVVINTAISYFLELNSFFNLVVFSLAIAFMYYFGKVLFRPIEKVPLLNKLIK